MKDKIISCLPDRHDRHRSNIELALRYSSRDPVLAAAARIREGLAYALSIDNFIEHRRGDDLLVKLAKLAIARSIASAEYWSKPAVATRGNSPWPDCTYLRIFQMITEGVHQSRLEGAFERVAFINFNYDRCLQGYLVHGLVKYSGLPQNDAAELVKRVKIKHVYGSLGDPPWLGGDGPVYGADADSLELQSIAERLKTFSEEIDSAHNDQIRSYVASAERLIFLGGAYHRQNLELIRPEMSDQFAVYGTVYEPAPGDPDNRSAPAIQDFAKPIANSVRLVLREWPMATPFGIRMSDSYKLEPLTNLQLVQRYRGEWLAERVR